ncbi:AIF_collapsed_G0031600.mRNA.1.CDS.1 [Saccharomyces cerevisiae]|nr:AIF_collapsed_G0031600.mRNA.1.CDS.1 [Saccharomyces cerevisiae]
MTPINFFSNTDQGPEKNNLKGEQLGSQKSHQKVTHKIKNAKEIDKINRQRMWEEQQLRNAMAGQSDHPDDITLEGSDQVRLCVRHRCND